LFFLVYFYEIISGIPHGSRARPILFQTQSLQKKATAYPSIGQKKLSGAAARMMIFFGAVASSEIYQSHPSDSNRLTSHSNIFIGLSYTLCSKTAMSESMSDVLREDLSLFIYIYKYNYVRSFWSQPLEKKAPFEVDFQHL
jgi:hypothetical protein